MRGADGRKTLQREGQLPRHAETLGGWGGYSMEGKAAVQAQHQLCNAWATKEGPVLGSCPPAAPFCTAGVPPGFSSRVTC